MNEETNQLIALVKEIEDLKKKVQEAEGELAIIKGIGNKSPEMKSLKSEVSALKQQLHTDRENYQKEVALVREDAQVIQLQADKDWIRRIADLEAINKSHQKLNGELQEKLSKYEDKAAHYRRKAIL